MRMVFAQL